MADAEQSTDANQSQESSASSTENSQEQEVKTSTGENTGTSQATEQQSIPYTRFHEVVEQKNREKELRTQYETKIRELESRLPQTATQQGVDSEVARLVKDIGMSEEAAKAVVATQKSIADRTMAEVRQHQHQQDVRSWSDNLSKRFKDYDEYVPQMEKVWNEMSPNEQALVVSSQRGLEMLYKHVRSDTLEAKVKESYQKGADQAYQNKAGKQAVSNSSGASSANPNGKLTRESIAKMPIEEYMKRQAEINDAVKAGLI